MSSASLLQLMLLSAVWGVSFLLIRIAGESFPPLWIALMRSTLGAALLWAVFALRRRSLPPRSALPWLAVVALFNNAIPYACFAWGEQTVPSNTASVLNATTPLWTLLLGMAVHRTHAGRSVIAGVLLGFAGVVLVVSHQENAVAASVTHTQFLRGVALISCGALGYAIATLVAKATLQGIDPLAVAASQLGLAALMVAPFALVFSRPGHLNLTQGLAIAVLGFAGSGIAYLLYFHLLTTMSATHVIAVTYLLPIWGIFWGAVAHEPVGRATFLGVAITIAGLVLMNLRRTAPPAPPR